MSKKMTADELNNLVKSALSQISILFQSWIDSGNHYLLNKATLVAYWLRDYTAFLRLEDTFSPHSVPRLKRGHVIVVDFGFRIGKEFGGRHFAVVVDNQNSLNSAIVTVVPLFSLKDGYTPSKYTCKLDDGIYEPMLQRAKAILAEAQQLSEELSTVEQEEKRSTPEYRAKVAVASSLIERGKRILAEMEHMKSGSIANSCQITTISKLRIKRPLNKNDPLYGLRLSSRDMEKINEQVSQLFIFHN